MFDFVVVGPKIGSVISGLSMLCDLAFLLDVFLSIGSAISATLSEVVCFLVRMLLVLRALGLSSSTVLSSSFLVSSGNGFH